MSGKDTKRRYLLFSSEIKYHWQYYQLISQCFKSKWSFVRYSLRVCSITNKLPIQLKICLINNPNLIKKRYLFVPLNLENMHCSLVIVMSQVKTMLYFNSIHKFTEPKELFNLITFFMNFYYLNHKIYQFNWDYLYCDEVYQQKTSKGRGIFCCLNAYYFVNVDSRIKTRIHQQLGTGWHTSATDFILSFKE